MTPSETRDTDVRWTVHTPAGVYADIWADSPRSAKRRVWRMTLGRVRIEDMVAVRTS